MGEITFSYPWWFIVFCLLLGAAYAAGLYFKDPTFKHASGQSQKLLYGLSFIRFLTVSFIAFLLLGPLLKDRITEEEQPVIVLATDNSSSINRTLSPEDSSALVSEFTQLQSDLSRDYKVATFHFGSDVKEGIAASFEDNSTNISDAMNSIYNLYNNQNVGAVILSTDGIYNEGNNPLYVSNQLDAPIYTIGLGDTNQQRDLNLKYVYHNSIAYLGDKVEIKTDIEAHNAKGSSPVLKISEVEEDGTLNEVDSEKLNVNQDNQFFEQSFFVEPEETDVQQYRLSISHIDGEVTYQNNSRTIFIDVLDSRKKVLLVANGPHPDLTAIKQALEGSKNYEVTIGYAGDPGINPKGHNMMVLHQLPSGKHTAQSYIEAAKEEKTPIWYIYGTATDINRLNAAQEVLTVNSKTGGYNDAIPVVAKNFTLFSLPNEMGQNISSFPPVKVPFGNFELGPGASALLTQKIGSVNTGFPLLVYSQSQGSREAVLLGEGLWRWRLYDYLENGTHENIDQLITQTTQFLSVTDDKRQFKVDMPKNVFDENEQIVLNAELYNENYELTNKPDVELTLQNEEGREFNFQFSKQGRSYRLNAGYFPAGNYTYEAKVVFNAKEYTDRGRFSIKAINLESLVTTANHRLLNQLSQGTGGRLFYPGQVDQLKSEITNNTAIKPVLRDSFQTTSIISLKWLFAVVLFLLAMEWFIRKYNGAY